MGDVIKKIKILYTIPNFDTAGSGKVLYDLAKGLDKTKFDVVIACTHNKGAFYKEVEALGLPITLIDTTSPLRPYFSLFSRVKPYKQFLQTQGIDIVHSWHWSSDWSEVLAAKLAGVKFVYTKKAMSWGNIHWKLRSFLSDFIITINDEMSQYFRYKKNQKLIPLGLDTNYYSPEHFEKENKTGFKISTVANLVPVKGLEVLIQAVNHLKHLDIRLDIIGNDKGDYGQRLKQMVKGLELEHKITFLGRQPDVRPYLSASDVYIIPTLDEGRKEGMPMALVEAMSMQVPVLGSSISGIQYVLKDFKHLLFEPNNIQQLSDKIIEFYTMTETERLNIAKALRHYCITHFSLTSCIEAHESLYLKLAEQQ